MIDRNDPLFKNIPDWAWSTFDRFCKDIPLTIEGNVALDEVAAMLEVIVGCGTDSLPRNALEWKELEYSAGVAWELSYYSSLSPAKVVSKLMRGTAAEKRPWRQIKQSLVRHHDDCRSSGRQEIEVLDVVEWCEALEEKVLMDRMRLEVPAGSILAHFIMTLPFGDIVKAASQYQKKNRSHVRQASAETALRRSVGVENEFKVSRRMSPTADGRKAKTVDEWIHVYELERFVWSKHQER